MPRWRWTQMIKSFQDTNDAVENEKIKRELMTLKEQMNSEFVMKSFLVIATIISVLALVYWYGENTYDPNAPTDYLQEEDAALEDAQFNSYRGY